MISSGGGDNGTPGGMSGWRARLEAMEGTIKNLEGILGTHRGSASGQFGPARNYDFNTGRREAERGPGGRFVAPYQGQLNIGGVTATIQQRYFREMHQMAMDIHSLVRGPRPAQPTLNLAAYTPTTAAAYNYTPYLRRGGGGSVPPSGTFGNLPPQFGPWGPRFPMGGGGGAGGGGGGASASSGGRGRGGGWPFSFAPGRGGLGAAAGGAGGLLGHYGILRGLLIGEVAGEIGGEVIKDILNPARLSTEILGSFQGAINPYLKAALPYYALGTTGGFSGQNLFNKFASHGHPGQEFMTKYGVTNEEIQRNFAAFGLFPHDENQGVRIAKNLAIGQRLPGFAGLDPGIPLGMARQAGGLGIESTEGATDRYLRKLADYSVNWTREGVDSAQIFKSMSGSLDVIAKSGATGIGADSIQRLFDQLVNTGLPGGRNGSLAAQMIGSSTAANNMLGSDSFRNAMLAIGLQQHGGFNAEAVKSLLGPEVMEKIGGEGGQQFQAILQSMREGDYPGAYAAIGNALNAVSQRGAEVFFNTQRGLGIASGSAGIGNRTFYGTSFSVSQGLRGSSPWNAPTDTSGTIEQNLRRSAARYGINPDQFVAMARAEGLGQPFGEMDSGAMSYGALRMHIGGLGTEFQKATGLDPSDPKNESAMNDWAAWYASTHGFGSWSSVTKRRVAAPQITPIMGGGDLTRYAVGNARPGGPSSITGVNPAFAQRISAMVAAMPPDIRSKFGIESGYRDAARQGQVNPRVKNSHHMYGLAVDLVKNPAVLSWIQQHGSEFGVGFPLADDPKEINHLEPLENGKRVTDMKDWIAQHNATNGNGPMANMQGDSRGVAGIQMPKGVGVAPQAEATGIAAGETNLTNFSTAVGTATTAVEGLSGAIARFSKYLADQARSKGYNVTPVEPAGPQSYAKP